MTGREVAAVRTVVLAAGTTGAAVGAVYAQLTNIKDIISAKTHVEYSFASPRWNRVSYSRRAVAHACLD